MSELFDKQCKRIERKSFWGSRELPQAHEKCVMKMKIEVLEEKRRAPKIFLMEGRNKACEKNLYNGYQIIDTLKVLFV